MRTNTPAAQERAAKADESTPDDWDRLSPSGAPYCKLVKRDAVTVPNRHRSEPIHRDAVVIITDDLAGIVKGPGARQSWQVRDPEQTAIELARVIDEWITDGGDPYGSSELNDRLEATARDVDCDDDVSPQ